MDDHQPSLLRDPISVSDLIGTGTKFQMNTDYDNGLCDNLYDDEGDFDDDNIDDGVELNHTQMKSPWLKPFEELRQQMIQIDQDIYKRIVVHGNMEKGAMPENSRVQIRYNSYWEGEGAPFDSSFLRGTVFSFYTGKNSVLEGLEKAVRSMYEGEEAHFVISYNLLFGEMGCPPRIKRKANGLYVIELVSFNAVGNLDAVNDIPEEDRKNYAVVVEKVKDLHLKGVDFFKLNKYKPASLAFEKAIEALNLCTLKNQEEEKDQTEFLIKLHTGLAVLYNKLDKPRNACLMCQEIGRLSNNKPPCKVLFHEGRALLKLGEFKKAKNLLIRAQHMEPHNNSINEELSELEKCLKKHHESEVTIWKKALGFQKPQENTNTAPEEDNVSTEFKESMREILQDFKKMPGKKFGIPSNLTIAEVDVIAKLAQSFDMNLKLENDTFYSLHKN